jgi:hypothetical protein
MTEQEIFEHLCVYDKRSPFCNEEITGPQEPRIDCFCDNCFYGRDKLAVEILRLQEKRPC